MAAVKVVLPWSMWPMVPMFRWGLVRWNFCFAMERHAPHAGSGRPGRGLDAVVNDSGFAGGLPQVAAWGSPGGYSPRIRLTISWAIESGTSWYELNCML